MKTAATNQMTYTQKRTMSNNKGMKYHFCVVYDSEVGLRICLETV